MIKLYRNIVVLLILLLLALGAQAQKKVKLQQADGLYGGVDKETGERLDRFIGNVVFKQDETTIYSDSAYFYRKRNFVEAFGRVKIQEGDSVVITSRKLTYDGDQKVAKLRENVVFKKLNSTTLYTDFLDYDRIKQEAKYFNGGKLVDSTNTLTSVKGYYQVNTNMASFKKDVVGKNPDYTMKSDTLQYNTRSNIIFFRGPTELTNTQGDVFNYNEGIYNTREKQSNLNTGEIETASYILTGERLMLDDIKKIYKGMGDVEMISKEQDVIITGDNSFFDKNKGIAKVYGHALMKKIMENDTLYLSADTLVAIENDDPAKKRLLAYKNVKIFKSDLQGKADSLAYFTADSTIYFYRDPVLWTGGNQLTADSINLEIANNTIDKLNLNFNSFVISEDSLKNFNQVKGRKMVVNFQNGGLHKVDVNGNGESIFFALDENDAYVVGMNKILCSDMVINFLQNRADNVSFYVRPDASFIPPHEIMQGQKALEGFAWRVEEKPSKVEVTGRLQPSENTRKSRAEKFKKIDSSEKKILPADEKIEKNNNQLKN